MSGKLTALSLKNYFRFTGRTNLKLFVYIFFFTAVLSISEINFLPQVFAQELIGTNKNNDDEQKILSEIQIAKEFIGNEKWEKARIKLTNIISGFPKNRYLDIA